MDFQTLLGGTEDEKFKIGFSKKKYAPTVSFYFPSLFNHILQLLQQHSISFLVQPSFADTFSFLRRISNKSYISFASYPEIFNNSSQSSIRPRNLFFDHFFDIGDSVVEFVQNVFDDVRVVESSFVVVEFCFQVEARFFLEVRHEIKRVYRKNGKMEVF